MSNEKEIDASLWLVDNHLLDLSEISPWKLRSRFMTVLHEDLDFCAILLVTDLHQYLHFCAILLARDLHQYLNLCAVLPSDGRTARSVLNSYWSSSDRSRQTLNFCAIMPPDGRTAQKFKVRLDLCWILICQVQTDLDKLRFFVLLCHLMAEQHKYSKFV